MLSYAFIKNNDLIHASSSIVLVSFRFIWI